MTRIGIRLLAIALLVLSPACSPTAVASPVGPTEAAADPAPGGIVRHFDITAEAATIELKPGLHINAWTYNGTVPGPTLRATVGDLIDVSFHNHLPESTTIHWHGLPVPNGQDGVGGITQDPVPSGSSARYAFVATTDGTYWYHSHQNSLAQLDRGLYGVIIIAPRTQPSAPGTDATLVFDEWPLGLERPSPPPASDFSMISYVTYTVNTKTGSAIAPVRFEPGKLVRLRLLNVGAFDHFVHIDGQPVTIVAFDGHTVRGGPPTTDALPLGPAERLDVEFTGPDTALWIHLQDGMPPAADLVVPLLPVAMAVPQRPNEFPPAKVLDLLNYPADALEPVWPKDASPNKTFTLHLSAELPPPGVKAMSPDETLYEINGNVFPDTGSLEVGLSDLVEITFVNDTSVDHPMHLHGMSFQIITVNGLRPAGVLVKDTVVVAPKASVTIGFKADNPGWWMLHCHILYHSLGGMMILVHVGGAPRLAQLGGPFGGSPD